MKKIGWVFLIALTLFVTGCTNQEEKAQKAFDEKNYSEVVSLLKDEEKPTATAEKLYASSQAQLAYEKYDYETVVQLLEENEGDSSSDDILLISKAQLAVEKEAYQEALDHIQEIDNDELEELRQTCHYELAVAALTKGIEERNAEEIQKQLTAAQKTLVEERALQLTETLQTSLDPTFTELDIDNFYFAEQTLALLQKDKEQNTELVEYLQTKLDENSETKMKAFLNQAWMRQDDTNISGSKIKVQFTNESGIALITEVVETTESYFEIKDIKWKDIQYIDAEHFTFEDLAKSNSRSYYAPAVGTINYSEKKINVHVSAEANALGTDQVWGLVPVAE